MNAHDAVDDFAKLLDDVIDEYQKQLSGHPIAKLVGDDRVPDSILREFAIFQFVDGVLWIPMLAMMKDRVSNKRLKLALTENILCEAGAEGVSHVERCRSFIKSLDLNPFTPEIYEYVSAAWKMLLPVDGWSEPYIAGRMLAAEALVPTLFRIFSEGFRRKQSVDMTYIDEHIVVDADEHSQWMRESALEILQQDPNALEEILKGIHESAAATLAVPDDLYNKTRAMKR